MNLGIIRLHAKVMIINIQNQYHVPQHKIVGNIYTNGSDYKKQKCQLLFYFL